MNWLTLSFFQVAAISALAGAFALWLYLRQPRAARLRVSTLRFWENAPSGSSAARRRKLREPWALLSQLFFLLLVIAALGNPRWGPISEGRNVAIVIDAGAWSQMHPVERSSWLDDIRVQAQNVLQRLPSDDRVLLLRADSVGAPILPFTTDRSALRLAIAGLQSSSAVADIPRALEQGRAALADVSSAAVSRQRGLLVYIGPGLMDEKQAHEFEDFRQSLIPQADSGDNALPGDAGGQPEFLARVVSDPSPLQNLGITQIALKRNAAAPDEWSVMTQIRNYNDAPAKIVLSLSVGGHIFREDRVSVAAEAVQSASDDFTSRSGGLLQAEIMPGDDLAADNRATIALPSSQPVSVTVVTSRASFAGKLRAVLSANPYVKTTFIRAGTAPASSADVVVYDGAVPAGASAPATISFLSPPQDSSAHRVRLANWNAAHPVTRWIQSRDVTVRAAASLKPAQGDVILASTGGTSPEPLILAREDSRHRSVIVGFDPLDSNFTEEPAFPLLMAAAVEWMTHPVQDRGDFLYAGAVDLPQPISRIAAPSGRDVLFAGNDSSVHFYAGESGLYRITSAGESFVVPVNVPVLPTVRLVPTAAEAAPLAVQAIPIAQQELWRWLVALALVALWLEWRLFYFRRSKTEQPASPPAPTSPENADSDRNAESFSAAMRTP